MNGKFARSNFASTANIRGTEKKKVRRRRTSSSILWIMIARNAHWRGRSSLFLRFTFTSPFGFARRWRHYTSGVHQVTHHDLLVHDPTISCEKTYLLRIDRIGWELMKSTDEANTALFIEGYPLTFLKYYSKIFKFSDMYDLFYFLQSFKLSFN